jgi:hypothetical protein
VRQVKNLAGKSRKKDNDKNEEHSFLFFSFGGQKSKFTK